MTIQVTHSPSSPKPGDSILVEVRLTQQAAPLLGASVRGRLSVWTLQGVSTPHELSFRDDGTGDDVTGSDGVYSIRYTAAQPGSYDVEIKATDGKSFERLAVSGVRVSKEGARVIGRARETAVDSDQDGKYESLKVWVDVEVSDAQGSYTLHGRLEHESRQLIGLPPDLGQVQVEEPVVWGEVQRTTGIHEVELLFPGAWLITSRLDGPYRLLVQLEDQASHTLFGSLGQWYRTKPYRWEDFEGK